MAGSRSLRGALLFAVAAAATPARAEDPGAVMDQFFSIWDDNARVTPQAVQSLYGQRVLYYGEALSNAGVYANKRAFIRRWPNRRYAVVPGTLTKGCAVPQMRCQVSVTLAWQARSGEREAAAHGLTRVTLGMEKQDGTMKVVSESGRPVSR